MKRAAFVIATAAAVAAPWSRNAAADIAAPEPHAYGSNRLYVGGLGYSLAHAGSFDIFVDIRFETGVVPFDPPPPDADGTTDPADFIVWRMISLNGLPLGEPVIHGIPPVNFFDLFAEISIDGGQTWIAAEASSRFTLVPAPGAAAMAGLAGLAMARRVRRS